MLRIAIIVIVALIALGCQFSLAPWTDIPPVGDDIREMDVAVYRTSDGAFIMGNRNAPITIVIFSDYMCSHCQRYNETMNMIIDEFVRAEQARVERRLVAILGELSIQYAKLAECVAVVSGDNRLFWVANDLLFEYGQAGGVSSDEARGRLANRFGLSEASLAECAITADQYITDGDWGRLVGLTGTPSVRILFGTFDATDGQTPQPISPSYMAGGVDIAVLRETIQNANK